MVELLAVASTGLFAKTSRTPSMFSLTASDEAPAVLHNLINIESRLRGARPERWGVDTSQPDQSRQVRHGDGIRDCELASCGDRNMFLGRMTNCMRFVGAILLGPGALLTGGCGAVGAYPPAPANVQVLEHRYKIGPLDILNITVWRNPELSSTVTVRPDGRIAIPLVDDVMAAGKNPSELARELEKGLSKLLRDPTVTVVVSGFTGTFSEQIRIVGEATRPQAIPFRQNMTILDVMIQAGGLTDFADGNSAVLVRGAESGKQYSVRLKDLLKRGDISANVSVMPGDVIIVPQSWF